ncbi:cytochrome c [Dyella tabacisoli]|uniref:Cytochrome C n=1 Tax=Dyella tabacisoli TaxID=2282381 RepID=A0A369UMX5_9GAMM|nr:cytochrome c [Dyella tabacisoli]RDD81827.1 cytochrome C [Dyella tabacisoli]
MRVALLMVLGLVIGIVGTVFAMNALRERNPFPHAVMVVMSHHLGELRTAVKAQRCDTNQTREHLTALLSMSADVAPAFPGVEQPFIEAADHLHGQVQTALQTVPADCAALTAAIKPIGDACQSCHQKYR